MKEEDIDIGGYQKGDKIPQGWCYLCHAAHVWAQPCLRPVKRDDGVRPCTWCGKDFAQIDRGIRTSGHPARYCGDECKDEARRDRKRVHPRGPLIL